MAELHSASATAEFILHAPEQKRLTMVITLWAWCSERNKIREEGKRKPIAQGIKLYAAEVFKHGSNAEIRCSEAK